MDTSETEPVVARPAKRGWRRHSDEFKARVIELARQPQASVAAVALANGLNANMLRRWVRESERLLALPPASPAPTPMLGTAFVQLPIAHDRPVAPPPPVAGSVEVKIRRGQAEVVVSLPLSNASAAWLREVLG